MNRTEILRLLAGKQSRSADERQVECLDFWHVLSLCALWHKTSHTKSVICFQFNYLLSTDSFVPAINI